MKLGIIGLFGAGKTTFFNSLTQKGASNNHSKDPTLGIATIPDNRLIFLEKLYNAKKVTHATIEFMDIVGTNSSGVGKQLLNFVREVDALIHVVRCFEDDSNPHPKGSINPIRDIEAINLELIFSDLEIVEKRIIKTTKEAKVNKSLSTELVLLDKLKQTLEEGKLLKSQEYDDNEKTMLRGFNLLSLKPVIYVANILLDDVGKEIAHFGDIVAYAKEEGSLVLDICAQIEEEIANLPEQDRAPFLEDLGIEESGLNRLIFESYSLLGLISFLTAGEKEVRAWTIKQGIKAPEAAGKIHSDIERGFIRAEVVSYEALQKAGTFLDAKKQGEVRLEGKDYIVKDGDIINFRFNV